MTFRLECMTTDNDPPTPSSIYAERILREIAHSEPRAMLSYDFVKCTLNLQAQPLAVIDEKERAGMRMAAKAEGVEGAVGELIREEEEGELEVGRVRVLRVAVAMLEKALKEEKGEGGGEWKILETLWKDGEHGLLPHLVGLFIRVSKQVQIHFSLKAPPSRSDVDVELLFAISDELLRLTGRLVPHYPLTTRLTQILTTAIADVFVCTDAADLGYNPSSPVSIAASRTRQTCVEIVKRLSRKGAKTESGKFGAEVVFWTLLECGLSSGKERDPASHIVQVFVLIDQLLPNPAANLNGEGEDTTHWVTHVIPSVLHVLRTFFRALDRENKLHFIKRLVGLDQGTTGIGEWILLEEVKDLFNVLRSLQVAMVDDSGYHLVGQYQVSSALRFIAELMSSASSVREWCISSVTGTEGVAKMLGRCFLLLLDGHLVSPCQTQIATTLATATESSTLDPDLKFTIILLLLRSLQPPTELSFTTFKSGFLPALRLLKELSAESIDEDRLQREMGGAFSAVSDSESTLAGFDEESAEAILSALQWLPERDLANVTGVGNDPFVKLCSSMLEILSPGRTDDLEIVRAKFKASEEIPAATAEATSQLPLADHIELSLQALESFLQPPIPVPSTPPHNPQNQDILGLVTLSPPTALLRSPSTTGLTKTYFNNDFRQLRQQPSARQNTSRLPSMHVDVGIFT